MKEIYIVQSMHATSDLTVEVLLELSGGAGYLEFIERSILWKNRVIFDIAKAEGVVQVFADGQTKQHANECNALLENPDELEKTIMWLEQYKLSAEKDQKLKEALEKSYGKRIDWSGTVTETLRLRKEPGRRMYESSADFLKMLRDIQAYSPLRLYTTEDERLQEILQDLDIIRKRNELRETSGQRDEMVYRTVERTAGTKSILFMGINHELVDFYRADSGFAVACARLDTTGLEYRHANRDSIPAFFREIVERRYAEVVR